jgi:hypothetical protein
MLLLHHDKSNFLCNLDYDDRSDRFTRSPRLEFHEVLHMMCGRKSIRTRSAPPRARGGAHSHCFLSRVLFRYQIARSDILYLDFDDVAATKDAMRLQSHRALTADACAPPLQFGFEPAVCKRSDSGAT